MTRLDQYYDPFLAISAHLTGFQIVELLGTGMAAKYLEVTLLESDPEDVGFFFEAVERVLAPGQTAAKIRARIAGELMGVDHYRGLARQIVLLWYTGAWGGAVVSPEAYKQGLMWTAAETHPAGAKQPGFGSWASAPITLRRP
ncbi:MAG: hypothetical protein H6719_08705 [Sandaracinaceae bacterium]|nr:hypothetical protein [Sandaracinaceae bacterium]